MEKLCYRVGIGVAAGMIAGGAVDGLYPGTTELIKAGSASFMAQAFTAAVAGSAAGAISSVVYGQNVGRGLSSGVLSGLTGFAVGAATSAAISYGANVLRQLVTTVTNAVRGLVIAAGNITRDLFNAIGSIRLNKIRGNYAGPDYSAGIFFPYDDGTTVYNSVDDVPDNVWAAMQKANSPVDVRDEAYQRHDNDYRDAGRAPGGRNTAAFKKLTKISDQRLADNLWKTGRTDKSIDDIFNAVYTIGFKMKAGFGI